MMNPQPGRKIEENLFQTFSDIIKKELRQKSVSSPEVLSSMNYTTELELKDRALKKFWKINKLPSNPQTIVPSPKPRHYRTTSKRKALFKKGKIYLGFDDPEAKIRDLIPSNLEPEEHEAIYLFVREKLSLPQYHVIARNLNYVVIRGNYKNFYLIFNLRLMNKTIIQSLKVFSSFLQNTTLSVVAFYCYLAPSSSGYYLDNKDPDSRRIKKIYGKEYIDIEVLNQKYFFSPFTFSQINLSLLPGLLSKAKELLNPSPGDRFIDLYCGYGLFSFFIGQHLREVFAVDNSSLGIHSAIKMKEVFCKNSNFRFYPSNIQVHSLSKLFSKFSEKEEIFLLDPPRGGVPQNIIPFIANRNPKRVLHLFCYMENIIKSLHLWRQNKRKVIKVIPFDMFPGTLNLEIMVLIE